MGSRILFAKSSTSFKKKPQTQFKMGPPKPRSKRAAMDMDDGYSPMGQKKSKVGFKGEPMFLDGDSDDDQHMNGGVKKVKIGKQNGWGTNQLWTPCHQSRGRGHAYSCLSKIREDGPLSPA